MTDEITKKTDLPPIPTPVQEAIREVVTAIEEVCDERTADEGGVSGALLNNAISNLVNAIRTEVIADLSR